MPKSSEKPDFLKGEFNLPKLEEEVLAFWGSNKIFEKSLREDEDRKADKKEFVFYEGPPYANGKPGIHHVLARVVKDVMLRYKTMRGYYVPRRAGWDTHGLPVEMAAEKALGFKTKKEIEAFGVEKFNKAAQEQVWIHKDEWERLTERIGYWLDLKNAYITYSPEYVETVWFTLAQIHKNGLLYKGHKVVPWCTRCGTALSSHELAQGYKEATDQSVYLKFKLKPGQKIGPQLIKPEDHIYILSWTTTPWTLPGNVALAVGPNVKYRAIEKDGEYVIAAAGRLKDIGLENAGKSHELAGADLVGLEYEPLFDVEKLKSPVSYKIYPADFVTTTDGTGVVHTAVMYGEDDYRLGQEIGLPQHHTVDEEGKFTKDVPALAGEYAKSKETEERIFEHLKQRGALLRIEPYAHEYPYCWRCGTPILYYARTSWFIAMSRLRNELLKRNETINWMPQHVKEGRFGEWLREVKDWNLSRERYWGAPLPIWECGKCGRHEIVGSMDELNELAGGPKNHYWVMRHGEAESNIFNVIDSGQRKYLHLTPRGQEEVLKSITQFKRQLDKKGEKIDIIISSDVTRTKETETIDYAVLGKPEVSFDKRIEEIHLGPTLTGLPDKKYAEFYPTYESRFEKRPEGGESVRDLRSRIWEFLRDCESKYEGKNILIVSHEYPIWMFFQVAEGWSEKRAIDEKRAKPGEFIGFAEIRELPLKIIPRNETGAADLHRPYADEIALPCPRCGNRMGRVKEVADVWYDSGAMPFAEVHWPFGGSGERRMENREWDGTKPPHAYPADYIAEGMDQTRGWFYTLLAIATALGFEAPYKNVITFGLINDKFGQKMSKSKGNIVEPFSVIDKFGADAVRWYFYTGTPFGEPKNFDEQEVAKALRRTHLIIYNSFVFWKTYAAPSSILHDPSSSRNILDRWIAARLAELTASMTEKLDRYEIREAAIEIDSFVDDLSRWYIRRSRKRLQGKEWRMENGERRTDYENASATLHFVLLSLTKLLAPFTPFFAEGLYAALGGPKESVHLEEWPANGEWSMEHGAWNEILENMQTARDLAALGLAARADAKIKVRQPLSEFTVKNMELEGKEEFLVILRDEINVKKVSFDKTLEVDSKLNITITPELHEEGLLRELARMVQELRQKAGLEPKDKIALYLELPAGIRATVQKNELPLKSDVGAGLVEYKRTEKFDAEEETKLENDPVWVGIRKI
ncbi:MAG: class I tRNA ligase family protein [Patescibacteria group bacterium]|nr:class I tRNA ligase family protein [Patescibacteria group bacterium]